MRILLIGKNGQLGWELNRALPTLGGVTALDYPEINLANPQSLAPLIQEIAPNVIINAAAYTNVDKAESEPETARLVNAVAPGVIAETARRLGAALVHYSTDFVFDGRKSTPYVETDAPNPLNVYGRTKLEGELALRQVGGAYLTIRTSWVYSLRQGGFVSKVLQWARQQETLRVVDDQVGSPTWARLLAEATAQVLAQGRQDAPGYILEKAGLYHLAGAGSASRYAWAQAILACDPHPEQHTVKALLPAKTADFPAPAVRPAYSELSIRQFEAAFGLALPPWLDGLKLMFA